MCLAGVVWAAPAFANNGVNTPSISGVDANTVRANNQSTVVDPEGDVSGGVGCGVPVNYGFDYGQVYLYLDGNGDLYWVVETNGNIGDADGDGGYDTKSTNCGGVPSCVITEADNVHNVFAANTEAVRLYIDRNCDGNPDLTFRLTGNLLTSEDELAVEQDDFDAGKIGTVLGIEGTGWQGAPLQAGPDTPSCVADRNGAILIKIGNWADYFTNDATGDLFTGTNPCTFGWVVDSGNNSDSYNEDFVIGSFNVCNPQIDIEKNFSVEALCDSGDTTRVTLVITNTGNTLLESVEITDPLPAGLIYDDSFIDDPANPLGAPSGTDPVTWTGITMQPGESRTVSFRAMSDDCVGEPENIAFVSGQFSSACINGGEPAGVADIDTAYVSCQAPGVDVKCLSNPVACAGAGYSVSFRIYNTGDFGATVDYDATQDGSPAFNGSVFIAAGDSADVGDDFDMPEVCGDPIDFELTATLEGDCTATDSDHCTATCEAACVDVPDPLPVADCPGSEVQVCFDAINCSNLVENMTFTGMFGGNPVAVTPSNANSVDPGDTVHVCMTVDLPEECNPDGYAASVSAHATSASGGECIAEDSGSTTVSCLTPSVDIAAPGDQAVCVDQPWTAVFVVTNTSGDTENMVIDCTVAGNPLGSIVRNGIASGDTVHVDVHGTMPEVCGDPFDVVCSVTATIVDTECSDTDEDTTTISCMYACTNAVDPDTTRGCALSDVQVCFDVINCGNGVQDFTFSGTFDGDAHAVSPTSADNVDPGDTVTVCMTVTVPAGCDPDGYEAVIIAVGALDADPTCTHTDHATGIVACETPDVRIEKDVSPEATSSGSTVSLTVTNDGSATLDPVLVSDCFPSATIGFDDQQIIGGTCGATVSSVDIVGNQTCVSFTGFALDPGESCTITFDVDCLEFTGVAQPDTARVYGYCEGTYPYGEPSYDEDYGQLVCQTGTACPHTIGFWRQQCAQKNNGSTKICLAGMYDLWQCVLSKTGVVKWQMAGNSTSFITTAQMQAMSPANAFAALCDQLQGPRPMTLRDMAEVQYLGLMLNLCVGAIDENIVYDGPVQITVGALLDSIEAAINKDTIGKSSDDSKNIGNWETYVDNVNNGLSLLASGCPDRDAVFRNYGPCGSNSASDQGILLPAAAPDVVVAQAYPNPVALGAGVTINYRVPEVNGGQNVELRVYDTAGRLVTTLVSQPQSAGEFRADWNMTNDYGQRVPAGVYFYRLSVGPEVFTQKMMIVQH